MLREFQWTTGQKSDNGITITPEIEYKVWRIAIFKNIRLFGGEEKILQTAISGLNVLGYQCDTKRLIKELPYLLQVKRIWLLQIISELERQRLDPDYFSLQNNCGQCSPVAHVYIPKELRILGVKNIMEFSDNQMPQLKAEVKQIEKILLAKKLKYNIRLGALETLSFGLPPGLRN